MALVLALALGAGCQPAPRSNVDYGTAAPIGAWQLGAQDNLQGGGAAATGSGVVPTAGIGGGGIAGNGSLSGAGINGGFAGTESVGTAGVTGGIAGDGSFAGVGGGAAGTGSVGTGGGGTALSSLSFTVLTHSQNGEYAPRNVGAIWIETATGQFVKTLEVWAFIRAGHLNKWISETQGSRVDAVSSATLSNHKVHNATWNLKDAAGNPIADGAYKVIIETTDHNGAGAFASIDFMLSPSPVTLSPPDEKYYTGMQLVLQ